MAKLLKDTPVYVSCPHCGKVQHPRLKWARHHKSLKCRHCGKSLDLREKQAQSLIERTLKAVQAFGRALDGLRAEAKQSGKAVKAKKPKKSKGKKKAVKKKAKGKKPAKRAKSAKPVSMMSVSPAPSGNEPPA